jgi:hypothetical protein
MEVFQIRSKTTRFYKRRFDLSGVLWWRSWKVRQITIDAVSSIEELSQEDPVNVFFVAFGDSSVNLSVRMWITPEQSVYKVGSEAIIRIKKSIWC